MSVNNTIHKQMNGSVNEPNMFQNYETEKITCKARDVAENRQLYQVVLFFQPRSSCTTHLVLRCMHRAWGSRVEEPNNML